MSVAQSSTQFLHPIKQVELAANEEQSPAPKTTLSVPTPSPLPPVIKQETFPPPTPAQIKKWWGINEPYSLEGKIMPIRLLDGEMAYISEVKFEKRLRSELLGGILIRPKLKKAKEVEACVSRFKILDLDQNNVSEIEGHCFFISVGAEMGNRSLIYFNGWNAVKLRVSSYEDLSGYITCFDEEMDSPDLECVDDKLYWNYKDINNDGTLELIEKRIVKRWYRRADIKTKTTTNYFTLKNLKLIQFKPSVEEQTVKQETTSASPLEGTWKVTFDEDKQFGVKFFRNLHFKKGGSVIYYSSGGIGRGNWEQNGNSISFQTDNYFKWKAVMKDNFLSGTLTLSTQSRKTYQWTAHYLGKEEPNMLVSTTYCQEQRKRLCLEGHFGPNLPVTLLQVQSGTCAATTGKNFTSQETRMTKLVDVKCHSKEFHGALVGKMPSSVQYSLLKLKKLADKSKIRQVDTIARNSGILTWKTKRNNGENFFTLADSNKLDKEDYKSISQSLPTVYEFPIQDQKLLFAQYPYRYQYFKKESYNGPILFFQEKKVIPVLGMCASLINETTAFRINNSYYWDSIVGVCGSENMASIRLKIDSSGIVVMSLIRY
ncbi:hypothetical protein BGP_5430 [Beggiatoa sp. PS]|nr:hypothetical protein BGP_5430 [Beggiatoa sp. PS]